MLSQQLTIVIPTYNEEKYIARTLYAIASQSGTYKVKIIIADAKSTDNTRTIAETNAFELGLNLEIIDGGLPAVGRNNGVKLSKTPYVLFLDADITFTSSSAIKQVLDTISNQNLNMISSNPVYRGDLDWLAWFLLKINKIATLFLAKTHPFAIGGFTLVDRGIFLSLGGYDEKATQAEDWLLSKQIPVNKFKIIPDLFTQDNRRFKKYGYFNMIKLIWRNWINKNNVEYFKKDQGYF
jgi:glycosyltransferase involved in cell wall biosynthesis